MRAQRYGAIPVARRVGGLHDSIADGEAGFLFNAYEPAALEQAVERALERYGDRAAWRSMMRHAMAQQFGWDGSAARYLGVYPRALAGPAPAGVHRASDFLPTPHTHLPITLHHGRMTHDSDS